jgi:hypothetical protein
MHITRHDAMIKKRSMDENIVKTKLSPLSSPTGNLVFEEKADGSTRGWVVPGQSLTTIRLEPTDLIF